MGPWTAASSMPNGRSPPAVTLLLATLPTVGRNAETPAQFAGQRTEPPASLPCARQPKPDANAALAPPLDPPGVSRSSQGFSVGPNNGLSVCQRHENSGVLVRPRITAPAARKFTTSGASLDATVLSVFAAAACGADLREHARFQLQPGEFFDLAELQRQVRAGEFEERKVSPPSDEEVRQGRAQLREMGSRMFSDTAAGSCLCCSCVR